MDVKAPATAPTPVPAPTTRAECVAHMEAQHSVLDALKQRIQEEHTKLDQLIQLHNRLPEDKPE